MIFALLLPLGKTPVHGDPPALPALPGFDLKLPDAGIEELLNPQPGLATKRERAARIGKYFRPHRTDIAAISPDGKHIAYSSRENGMVSVVIVGAGELSKRIGKYAVVADDDLRNMAIGNVRADETAKILWMAWFPPARLAMATNRIADQRRGHVVAINADGSGAKLLASPGMLETSLMPVEPPGEMLVPDDPAPFVVHGFCTDDPHSVLLRTGWQTRYQRMISLMAGMTSEYKPRERRFSVFKLNINTGKLQRLFEEMHMFNIEASCLFDRQGHARITLRRPDPGGLDSNTVRRYRHAYPGRINAWRDLDEIVSPESGISGFAARPPAQNTAPTLPRSVPIGFDTDPNILYYASDGGGEKFGIYGLNLATGAGNGFALDLPARNERRFSESEFLRSDTLVYDEKLNTFVAIQDEFARHLSVAERQFSREDILVFDRYTNTLAGVGAPDPRHPWHPQRWLQPHLQHAQATLAVSLRDRVVTILGWTEDCARYLAHASGPADPGAYYLYDARQKTIDQITTCTPWLDENALHERIRLHVEGQNAPVILTLPKPAHRQPAGYSVVALCKTDPGPSVFRADAQALASMGYAVLETASPPAILPALDALAQHGVPVNRKRVALLGEGSGARAALRLLQAHPEHFRAAIAIEAPLADDSGVDAAAIKRPVCLMNTPADWRNAAAGSKRPIHYRNAKSLVKTVREAGITASFDDLPEGYSNANRFFDAKIEVYSRIEAFLFGVYNNPRVILGPMDVVEENVPPKRRSIRNPRSRIEQQASRPAQPD